MRLSIVSAVMCCTFFTLSDVAAGSGNSKREIRGVIRAETIAVLSSELTARVTSLPFKVGQAFRKNDTLVVFDCRRYRADLRAAKAEAAANRIIVARERRLVQRGAAGRMDLAISEAKYEQALAAVESLEVRLDQCQISAPFDGQVADQSIEVHERPQANAPLIKIVKSGQLEVDLIVPSRWLTWLTLGTSLTFSIDETGTQHHAEILRIGAIVDPISHTSKVVARLTDAGSIIRHGMSGEASFAPPNG